MSKNYEQMSDQIIACSGGGDNRIGLEHNQKINKRISQNIGYNIVWNVAVDENLLEWRFYNGTI